jgi:hypothetical protein
MRMGAVARPLVEVRPMSDCNDSNDSGGTCLSLVLIAFVLMVLLSGVGGAFVAVRLERSAREAEAAAEEAAAGAEADKVQPQPMAQNRSEAHGEQEKAVRDWIVDNANDPASVQFARWGPHNPKGNDDFLARLGVDVPKGVAVLRVRWREKNKVGALTLHDELFAVSESKVSRIGENHDGDDWIAAARAKVKKLSQDIKAAKDLPKW